VKNIALIVLSLFGLLVWSPSCWAITCKLDGTDKDLKAIAGSCEALMDTMDATDVKMQGFNLCCKNSNAYLKKNPIPCTEKTRVRYRIKLALSVCDTLKASELDYEHDYCLNQMLYHIYDTKVLEIADGCSPTGGRAAPGGRGGPKPEGGKEAGKEGDRSGHGGGGGGHSGGGGGADEPQKPVDLHLEDESYSKCQRKRLSKYLEQLDEEISKTPAESAACSKEKN
jgi:uncharacterized membrane protein YgcG